MLTPNQILSHAQSTNLTKNILTEYYQHELLESFFRQKNSEHFSFIGGTAIRICYGGGRFSEDLDFDTTKLSTFDQLLTDTVSDMKLKGFIIEHRLIHKGAYHCHLKFPHILKKLNLSGYKEEKLLIKVDSASIPKLYTKAHLLNRYGIFQTVKVAPAPVLLAKKLLTLADRRRTKARDIYDITYLWGLASPDEKYLEEFGHTTLKIQIKLLIAFTKNLNLKTLAQEASPFLVSQSDINRILQFPEFLQSKL